MGDLGQGHFSSCLSFFSRDGVLMLQEGGCWVWGQHSPQCSSLVGGSWRRWSGQRWTGGQTAGQGGGCRKQSLIASGCSAVALPPSPVDIEHPQHALCSLEALLPWRPLMGFLRREWRQWLQNCRGTEQHVCCPQAHTLCPLLHHRETQAQQW